MKEPATNDFSESKIPVDSVSGLRTLSLDAFIQICHNGNQSANATNPYFQAYVLPRNG